MHGRRSEVSFNTSWLEDLYEEIVAEVTGEKVTPLVSNPGRIMLTSSRLYFQPFNNVEVVRDLTGLTPPSCPRMRGHLWLCLSPQEPVLKLKLSELKYVMKRRYMLRHVVW